LSGETWLNGTAVSYALRVADMQRVPLPQWFVTNALAMNVMTWGVIAIELAVGILVWFPRLRPWVLSAGVLMHVIIDLYIQIGIFSYATFVMYLAWISPETVKHMPDRLRQVLGRRDHRKARAVLTSPGYKASLWPHKGRPLPRRIAG
jgi:Vitamin K-dependent gamma-carboxylase